MRRLLNDPRLKLQLHEADVKRTVPVPVQHIITTQVAGLEISGKEIDAFNGALGDAVELGAKDVAAQLGKDLGSRAESFISEFLKDGGFQRIAADIDKTTVDRVSNAVADTYERGGSYTDVVKSIKETFSGFSDTRAEADKRKPNSMTPIRRGSCSSRARPKRAARVGNRKAKRAQSAWTM